MTDTSQLSTPELVRQASDQLSRLVRDEMALARAELRDKGRHAGVGVGLFSGAGLVALYGVAGVLAAVVLALALVMPGWLAALLVGLVLLATAGVMALVGRGQLRRVAPPYPREALQGAKTDAALLREGARR
ncbi:MAG: phage holin family protein [Micromonosporaceae bacterium]